MSTAINCAMFTFSSGVNGLALAQFQSGQNNHQVLNNMNVPIANINHFTFQLNGIVNAVDDLDRSNLFCDVLEKALDMIRATSNNNAEFNDNMAIMVTNCTLNLGANFLTMSDRLKDRGIKLFVVAIGTPAFEIWDHYNTLARDTGGKYMLLQDAPSILTPIIQSTIFEGDTLRQASQHMHPANVVLVPNHLDEMNEQNQTTDGVGDLAFDHGLSE